MISIAIQGLRGGVGVSSVVAALGHALQSQGERVLLVDMCPENLLRLHCNQPVADGSGWARATLDGEGWKAWGWSVLPNLHVLPYGRLSEAEQGRLELHLRRTPQLWRSLQASLARSFDWVLFDLPQRLAGHAQIGACDLSIRLLEADPACHALLRQTPLRPQEWLLVNRYDPGCQLQRDLLLVWQQVLGQRLLVQGVHRDTAMREALANKHPVGAYAPGSLAAQDALGLARWCLERRQLPAVVGALLDAESGEGGRS